MDGASPPFNTLGSPPDDAVASSCWALAKSPVSNPLPDHDDASNCSAVANPPVNNPPPDHDDASNCSAIATPPVSNPPPDHDDASNCSAVANAPFNNTPPDHDGSRDCLRVLLLGRTGQGKSTMGNKLLKAGGGSVARDYKIEEFEVGGGGETCTREIRSLIRPGTENAKAIEVVDTPGFADSNTIERQGVYRANLAMFRDLIRTQRKNKLRVHRVLYFLPHRGPLERADAVLQEEIKVMHHFFGKAIFSRMVLVATHHKRNQRFGFNEEDTKDTRKTFEKALTLACRKGDRPKCPPILYVGLDDAGVMDIQHQIESAAVTDKEGLILDQFTHGACFKCGANYLCQEGNSSDPRNRMETDVPSKSEGRKDDEEVQIPHLPSYCHPLFIPKHSFWKRFAGEVAHAATLYIPALIQEWRKRELPWPAFTSNDEVCIHCQQGPGSKGCTEVGTMHKATLPTGNTVVVIVDHTNKFEDYHSHILGEIS